MKKLLLWLCIAFPILGAAQGSYFNIEVQFDEYGPDESFIVVTSQNDTLVNHTPSNPYEFFSTLVFTDAGEITISLFDNWGDGWQDGNDAFRGVIISNECQGEILNLDANFNFDQYDQVINLLPCPPPSFEGFTSSNASQQCLTGGQALIVFEWETDSYAVPIKVFYSNENGLGPLEYQIPPSANNFPVYAGNGQMPPNWSVEHYLQVEFSDGNISETIAYTPFSCIEGCTDPNQTSYNPSATIDDGSCSGTTCDTDTQYQITMEITFDNWPNETSWIMNSGGIIGEAAPGTYSYNDIGQTYTYSFCVNQGAGFELIVNDTYGDGMAGSTSGGDIDGTIVIYDCNGDIIWEMDNPDFGNVLYSGNQVGVQCEVAEEIYGCTNPNYLEYNPDATIDDGSCATEHVLGCMDENSINYNPDATKQELIPVCN